MMAPSAQARWLNLTDVQCATAMLRSFLPETELAATLSMDHVVRGGLFGSGEYDPMRLVQANQRVFEANLVKLLGGLPMQ
eukprot:CAMPEP_0170158468 /NCGR_PEP_ID=MMETSP0033_2-20121228/68388_1 /TAXON_ID=195969 /ORGANISM="Dolichomastix tenuilepis, Strain CCMP3274" /LENGTH=79 /DNA_ID=CAMNT_0010395911 /DNA_START=1 /DNA_END=237 /DNA_ORIENTATION=+